MQHAPRDQTEAPAPMPVHRAIATTPYVPGEKVRELKSFQFLDDGEHVKVYLPLENLDRITKANISADFQTRSFCVTIRDLQELPLQLRIARLQNDISPDECSVKVLKTKVMVKLRKSPVLDSSTADPDGTDKPQLESDAEDAADGPCLKDADNASDTANTAPAPVQVHYPHWSGLRCT